MLVALSKNARVQHIIRPSVIESVPIPYPQPPEPIAAIDLVPEAAAAIDLVPEAAAAEPPVDIGTPEGTAAIDLKPEAQDAIDLIPLPVRAEEE